MTSLSAPTPLLAPAAPRKLAPTQPPAPPSSSLPSLAAGLRELARERPLALTVRGDCMAPRLRDGERVTVTPARCYWPGDVVAFQTAQGRIAVHRLLGYRLVAGRLAWVTRGDRCASPDPPPGRERWLGRAAVPPTALERARALLALLALGWRAARRRLAR
ncbi:MAG TPA: S24/S26 family peptidase [Thermoanaerobaculia bacterium]|nr:S24/S26 family peptidase [Thermoanaerobaculia bacterium]